MHRSNTIRSTLCACAVLAALLTTACSDATQVPASPETIESAVAGNTAFAVDLYHQLRSTDGNLFFSPYSISAALGMTYAGARGNTAKEMAAALHFGIDQTRLHAAFRDLTRELTATAQDGQHKLSIANALCLTGGDVSDEFKALLKDSYDAKVFAGGLDEVNGWVKQKTEGKIEKILERLSRNSVCVLLNAIYFKGTWESQFKEKHTGDAPFRVSSQEQVTIPLMYQSNSFRLLEKPGFQAVSMPYKGGHLSMVVLLPQDVDGLAQLEEQLTTEGLKQWLAELDQAHPRKIELQIPKYKLGTGYDLVRPCQDLGMRDAFASAVADFRGMGWPKGDLWIAQIKHKAFVEVNEEGTEAAAATAVGMATESVARHPIFRADHPFLFMIRDRQTGSILFIGRLVDPSSE